MIDVEREKIWGTAFWNAPDRFSIEEDRLFLIAMRNSCRFETFYSLLGYVSADVARANIDRLPSPLDEYVANMLRSLEAKEIRLDLKAQKMNPKTMEVLRRIERYDAVKKGVLAGGTALSIWLEHRKSYDIDLFYKEKLPKEDIMRFARDTGARYVPLDNFVVDTFTNEGGEVEDYIQRYELDGVKIEFNVFGGNVFEQEIIDDYVERNGIKVASLEALKKLKTLVLLDRSRIRDLYDVVYMLERKILTPAQMFETVEQYRITCTPDRYLWHIDRMTPDPLDEGLDTPHSFEELKEALLSHLLVGMREIGQKYIKGPGVKR